MPRRNPPQRLSSHPHGRRLRVEPLEDRRMLATFVVDLLEDNTEDDGLTTLREAIALANGTVEADVIEFAPELFAEGARTLEVAEVGYSIFGNSAFSVRHHLTINGPGAALLTVDVSPLDSTRETNDGLGARHFILDTDSGSPRELDILLTGMTLTGGDSPYGGGSILMREGNLTLHSMVVSNNHVVSQGGQGGGILATSAQSVTIEKSSLSNNSATLDGGGLYATGVDVFVTESIVSGNSSQGFGGGIYTARPIIVSDSTFDGNQAKQGGGLYLVQGSASFTNTSIERNTSSELGGGIYVVNGVQTFTHVTFAQNASGTSGGGAYFASGRQTIADATIMHNTANALGGGIFSSSSELNIASSEIGFNEVHAAAPNSGHGGGIYSTAASFALHDSEIHHNYASGRGGGLSIATGQPSNRNSSIRNNAIRDNGAGGDGGGIFVTTSTNRSLKLSTQSIVRNHAAQGGGIAYRGSDTTSLEVSDSVIAANTATGFGGGVFANSGSGEMILTRSTIAENLSDSDRSGSGIGDGVFLQAGNLSVEGSIIAANGIEQSVSPDIGLIPTGILAVHYSLIGTNLGSGLVEAPLDAPDSNGNLIGGAIGGAIEPGLAPLGTYGGALEIMPLLPASPAVDAGDPLAEELPEFDMRGAPYVRAFDGDGDGADRIDMGATEIQSSPIGTTLVVDTLLDEFDDDYGEGDLSLREAIAIASLSVGDFSIMFAPELEGGVIQLLLGEMLIGRSLNITGPGEAGITLKLRDLPPSGPVSEESRMFRIDDGLSNYDSHVTVARLHFVGGLLLDESGGAILSYEHLTIEASSFLGNLSSQGGAIAAIGGKLEVSHSEFVENWTPYGFGGQGGGAIYGEGIEVVINHSSFRNNRADRGGAVMVMAELAKTEGRLVVHSSSFVLNRAETYGGAIAIWDLPIEISDTLFEGNLVTGQSGSRGGAIFSSRADVALEGSTFRRNGVAPPTVIYDFGISGGGIEAIGAYTSELLTRSLLIRNTLFEENKVTGDKQFLPVVESAGGFVVDEAVVDIDTAKD